MPDYDANNDDIRPFGHWLEESGEPAELRPAQPFGGSRRFAGRRRKKATLVSRSRRRRRICRAAVRQFVPAPSNRRARCQTRPAPPTGLPD